MARVARRNAMASVDRSVEARAAAARMMGQPLGAGVPHREFVRVSQRMFEDFHRRWRAIDRLWDSLSLDPEHWDAVRGLRESARDALRREARRDAQFAPGDYMIPV